MGDQRVRAASRPLDTRSGGRRTRRDAPEGVGEVVGDQQDAAFRIDQDADRTAQVWTILRAAFCSMSDTLPLADRGDGKSCRNF